MGYSLVMRKFVAAAVVIGLAAAACASASTERTVRVDFRQDEFASHYWRFFPGSVSAHPGDTVVFDQQWTGEPHTVTLGTRVDRSLPRIAAVERKYADVDENSPPDLLARAEREYEEATSGVAAFDPYQDAAAQNWLQPCYLSTGSPPKDRNSACAKRSQPEFNGRQSYYSSGFIAPTGPEGNTYRVPLSQDIAPGTYHFYCVVHFPEMQGRIVVKPESERLEEQAELNRAARAEIEKLAGPLRKALADARAGEATDTEGKPIPLPIGGYHSSDEYTVALDEFVPRTLTTRVGEPVTWSLVGAHTVSFGVPRYLPIYTVSAGGLVKRNSRVDKAAGGSPKAPPVDFLHETYRIDGGTWDGSGFISSGLLGSEPYSVYTLRFSKPDRYRYACLVHPPMVGTVIVRP